MVWLSILRQWFVIGLVVVLAVRLVSPILVVIGVYGAAVVIGLFWMVHLLEDFVPTSKSFFLLIAVITRVKSVVKHLTRADWFLLGVVVRLRHRFLEVELVILEGEVDLSVGSASQRGHQ